MTEESNQSENTTDSAQGGKKSFLGIGLALLLAAGAFFSGVHFGSNTNTNSLSLEAGLFSLFASNPTQPEEVDLTEFWRVWDLMEEKFVNASSTEFFSEEDRIRGAIEGLVDSYGDPYTVYLPPKDAEQFEEDISGNFGGVGMEVGIRDGMVTVIAPLPNTPAEQAGIMPSDIVVQIDGVSTEDMNIDEAVRLIRGEVGTTVELDVYREGEASLIKIPVVRDTITIPTLDTEVNGDVFIISLYSFNALADQKMREALQEYEDSQASKIVFDLRGNPGGFLHSAVSIASYFLPAGKVVVRESFGEGTEEELYRSSGRLSGVVMPEEMVVLINGGSASASEILAGALQEHDVAVLMGETSFGKGSVQELVELPDNSSLKVTIARWFTPNGTSISEGGLNPDFEVQRTVEDLQNDIDPQLDAALAWLNGDKELMEYLATSTLEVIE